jgi:hypothetical protein
LPHNVVTLNPVPANLVTALTDQLVASIMAPAVEALSPISVRRIRRVVEQHVMAGRWTAARNLVASEIEVSSVAAEITRHQSGDCDVCPDGWRYCETLARMEAREARLFDQIQRAGGGI